MAYYNGRRVHFANDATPEPETYCNTFLRPHRNYEFGHPHHRPLDMQVAIRNNPEIHIHHNSTSSPPNTSLLPISRHSPTTSPMAGRRHHRRRHSTSGLLEPRYSASSVSSEDGNEESNVDKMIKIVDKSRELRYNLALGYDAERREHSMTHGAVPRTYREPYYPPPIMVPVFKEKEYVPLAPPAPGPTFETNVTEVSPEAVGAYPVPIRHREPIVYHGAQVYYNSTAPPRIHGRIWAVSEKKRY